MSYIKYSPDCKIEEKNSVTPEQIEKILPHWETKILEIHEFKNSPKKYELTMLVAANTESQIKSWLEEYEEKNKASYSVTGTDATKGHFISFKQRLHCHHNTGSKMTYDSTKKNKTRNFNCPSTILVRLRVLHQKYRGRDQSKAPDPKMLCEVRLCPTHNHETDSAEALKFRKVDEETQTKLLKLFEYGHTPATALESLKMEIQLNEKNYKEVLRDRKYCPDYMFVYHLYAKKFKQKHAVAEKSSNLLKKMIEKCNEISPNSVEMANHGKDEYVICICPPLFRRIHEYNQYAKEIVFVDSFGPIDRKGGRLFILLTHSECGDLPLAVLITSTEDDSLFKSGLVLLKKMTEGNLFNGREEGPTLFLTEDNADLMSDLTEMWPESSCLLCTFHVLRSLWRWLTTLKNGVRSEDQQSLFQDFRAMLYANTASECELQYYQAYQNAAEYKNYQIFLKRYWDRRELWALYYRHKYDRSYGTNDYSEAAMRLLKERLLERVKAFKLVHLVDFMSSKFVKYYEQKIEDSAFNRLYENLLSDDVVAPNETILDKLKTLTDTIYLVPCDNVPSLMYIVNSEILSCTCDQGRNGKICKHICWVCYLVLPKKFADKVNIDESSRQTLYYIATGRLPTLEDHTYSKEMVKEDEMMAEACDSNVVEEALIAEGNEKISNICELFGEFLKKAPRDVNKNFDFMLEHLKNIDTVSDFTSSCYNFGSEIIVIKE